jgi:hypothetical protein
MPEFTPHQQKVIDRYYRNRDQLAEQRLAELVSEVYLASGKKLDQLWKQVEAALGKLKLPAARVEHLMAQRDPELLAGVVKELQAQ